MPKPGDFEHHERVANEAKNSNSKNKGGHKDGDDHKCYVTGWGRRTESKIIDARREEKRSFFGVF